MSLTIDEYLTALAPEVWNDEWETAPSWPGDVFAIVASLLERSGVYSGLGTHFWRKSDRRWEDTVAKLAASWRRKLPDGQPPAKVRNWWSFLATAFDTPIAEISENPDLCECLLRLAAVCDQVFEGVGVIPLAELTRPDTERGKAEFKFWYECIRLLGRDLDAADEEDVLSENIWDRQASLCSRIHPTRLRVMPKAQTPRYGLSIRSLTHYVGLCPPILMKASWNWHAHVHADIAEHFCNILLFPWPFEVTPRQFSTASETNGGTRWSPNHPNTGWFQYQPRDDVEPWRLANEVVDYITRAEQTIGRIHVVVLPEAALTELQYARLQEVAHDKGVILVSGVVRDTRTGKSNAAGVTFAKQLQEASPVDFEQHKHHRWKLDEDQIVRYSLTGVLDPHREWWESIAISDRSLSVFPIREWLCTCALICEDLARLDPAGQFVRALAPDLVIALLFDGPQLATRWPAYYATVLAEDPGSSVLTITSLGMARLSRPKRHDPNIENDVIGMWRDIQHSAIEIKLPRGKNAAVLTVQRKAVPVATADGRCKSVNALTPIFGGLSYL